jgi:hypothetical protein
MVHMQHKLLILLDARKLSTLWVAGSKPAGIANFGHEKNSTNKGFLEFAQECGFERSAERNGIKADTWRSDDVRPMRRRRGEPGGTTDRTGFRRWRSGAVPAPSQPGCKPAVSDRVGAAERAQVEKMRYDAVF